MDPLSAIAIGGPVLREALTAYEKLLALRARRAAGLPITTADLDALFGEVRDQDYNDFINAEVERRKQALLTAKQ